MSKLNLETFNDILVNTGGMNEVELLEMELQMAYQIKIQLMESMVDLANAGQDFADTLNQINNVDANCDRLGAMLDEARSKQEEQNHEV